MSAQRPAQPLNCARPWGTAVCHCSIWSLCENNALGTGSAAFWPFSHALNCALLMGCTSVPTFDTKERRRLPVEFPAAVPAFVPFAIACKFTHDGCNPKFA